MKKIFCLFLVLGFALSVFAQTEHREYRSGINKKKLSFQSPIIRLGTISDSSFTAPIFFESTVPDTQAIYVVKLKVDSSYIVTAVDSVRSNIEIDTIHKVGERLYANNLNKAINYEDDYWEVIQEYLVDYPISSDTIEENVMPLDTQVFYVLTEKTDSLVVINDSIDLQPSILVDRANIDTFYQVGSEIFQDDLRSSVENEDWEIMKETLLKDADPKLEDLSYEEYLIAQRQLDSSNIESTTSFFEPIILDEKSMTPKVESIRKEKINSINQPINTSSASGLDSINTRMLKMEKALEAMLNKQAQEEVETPMVSTPLQVTPSDQEVIGLRRKIEELEVQVDQENEAEIEKMKQQLLLYEQQRKENENQELQAKMEENNKLRATIGSLQNQINSTQEIPDSSLTKTESSKSEAIGELKSDIAAINENIVLMKQLLLQQQIIDSLKKESSIVETSKDTSNNELAVLKQEIAALKASLANGNETLVPVNATTINDDNKVQIDTLKQQIGQLQEELKRIKEEKTSIPKVEKIVAEPITLKPTSVMENIRGKEKQIIFFKLGSYKLPETASSQVSSIVQLMLRFDELVVVLEAYTDSSGDAAKNLLLSKRRAESVKESILKYGIPSNRILLDFRGEDTQNKPSFGRRVEMILKEK